MDRVQLNELQRRSRRNRNIAIGVTLGVLVVIFYAITIIKMAPGALH
ncbi:hypothetical protein [Rhizobium alvei]|uniref:Protoheme IX farnesyltransferase n=1 Tax=Rhizobium alvei TaxID=1132659 RepID=A0ABT8YGI1_9HYPH|nr:hypothetical protein [Rhizobium alvei]MDO6962779.1 hypothetical protein [Rhizobium alvei]